MYKRVRTGLKKMLDDDMLTDRSIIIDVSLPCQLPTHASIHRRIGQPGSGGAAAAARQLSPPVGDHTTHPSQPNHARILQKGRVRDYRKLHLDVVRLRAEEVFTFAAFKAKYMKKK